MGQVAMEKQSNFAVPDHTVICRTLRVHYLAINTLANPAGFSGRSLELASAIRATVILLGLFELAVPGPYYLGPFFWASAATNHETILSA